MTSRLVWNFHIRHAKGAVPKSNKTIRHLDSIESYSVICFQKLTVFISQLERHRQANRRNATQPHASIRERTGYFGPLRYMRRFPATVPTADVTGPLHAVRCLCQDVYYAAR